MLHGGVEAPAAGIVADTGEVFLFGETIAVFPAGTDTGKGDAVGIAPGREGTVDEFRAVITAGQILREALRILA
jgi:hypothetical protein